MKSAVIYIRVSTEEQDKFGFSVETQTHTCLEFAHREGYSIRKIYVEEGLSAKNLNRPEAQKLLKFCDSDKNNIQAIIVWRLDRLSRFNVDYHGTIRPILINRDIKLLSATEINADTIEGEYLRNIIMCNAEYELSLIRFRTKENMRTIASQGRLPAKAPIGYLNISKDKKNIGNPDNKAKIIIDEKNAKYIKRAFELYSTGMYSFKTLSDTLYLEGFKHPKTGEKFPARKIDWMLHNPFYTGKFIWSGEMYEGSHTPIITQELFYRVQAMFEGIDRSKKHDVEFAYTGLIKCAECGCYITAEFKRGKTKKGHYVYYHCSNKKNVHKKIKYYREEYFDNTFYNILETIHLEQEHIEKLKVLAKDYLKEFCEYEKATTTEIRKQIDILSKRIKNSYIDKLEGRLPECMSEEEFNTMYREWQIEKDKLMLKLQEGNISSKFIYSRIDKLLEFTENLPELFLKGTSEEKKKIVTAMTKSIKFDGENLIVELKDTFRALQNVNNTLRDIKKAEKKEVKNRQVRTLKTQSPTTKKDVFKTSFVNGAGNGLLSEPIKNLIIIIKSEEYNHIMNCFNELIA